MKSILQKILFKLSRAILTKYHPEIIGITGTVGKSSTKEAIYTVLRAKYGKLVRQNIKNYNNELGVPLTIIGAEAGGKNLWQWAWVMLRAAGQIILPLPYPKILILEMGVDRPQDMSYLTRLAPCNLGIVTAIGEESPVHVEFFKDREQLVREKLKMFKQLKADRWAVVNIDDKDIKQVSAELNALEINFSKPPSQGVNFKVKQAGNTVPFFIPHVVGLPTVYAALFGIAVGVIHKMNLVQISEALKKYQAPRGRLNLIPGIKHSLILDDSYNSSPKACKTALNVAQRLATVGQKYICLGDMAELGKYTQVAHQEIGQEVAALGFNGLFTIGEKAKIIAQSAIRAGMDQEKVFQFAKAEEAGKFIQERIKPGDLLLVKGSQSMRTEKIVKELMAEPQKARELLVRQGQGWTK